MNRTRKNCAAHRDFSIRCADCRLADYDSQQNRVVEAGYAVKLAKRALDNIELVGNEEFKDIARSELNRAEMALA